MQENPNQTADMTAVRNLLDRNALVALFERDSSGIIAADAITRRILAANPSAQDMLGRNMRELQQERLEDLLPQVPQCRVIRLFDRLMQRKVHRNVVRMQLNLGDERIIFLTLQIVPGEYPTILAQFSDETLQHTARIRADEAQKQLNTAIEALSDGFVLYDKDDRLVICNQTYREFYPLSAHAMRPGVTFSDILRAGLEAGEYREGIGREEAWLRDRLEAHTRSSNSIEQPLSDGRWLRIVERITSDGGRVGLRIDVSELKQQQERLHRMALTDELTGLRNRRGLREELLDRAAALPQGQTLAVFHIDLHRFKMINSAYGYEAGDRLLRHCADILRAEEAAGGLAARIGGNEFLLAVQICEDEGPQSIMTKLSAAFGTNFDVDGQHVSCVISCGIAVLDRSGAPHRTILQDAEIALNDAKETREAVCHFHPRLRQEVETANDLTRELKTAIETGALEAHFQPQFDAREERVIGFETLMRWNHPSRGCLAAGAFLSVAQRSGLTTELDDIAMDQACAAWRRLADLGHGDLPISINLSVDQLGDPRLLDRLNAARARHGTPADRLRMELLESILLDDRTKRYIRNINDLVDAGFEVELDDFGTGHAAIASLRQFKVSRIKIDRSFVRHIDGDKELQDLTGAIVGLADKLGIETLAEGVETQKEQSFLLSLGCNHAQGWLYSKAIPASELASYLSKAGPERAAAS
ncbi:EAL domain-containing protein [Salipiger sp. IMCC34102]|uniref:putative bifunctional diguanylate cyclase/phosphodiesterase n=1 Tax=Salipiger sp. IMCC34102 TaxID=2510647 RepID=UPI00101C78D3|nr:EAL domain-containing protein [Salipiger sp. IMCC34102]RYH01712.1 EAL domain-containing protein [Salipiger sp. IMCC34102]